MSKIIDNSIFQLFQTQICCLFLIKLQLGFLRRKKQVQITLSSMNSIKYLFTVEMNCVTYDKQHIQDEIARRLYTQY